MKTSSFGLLCFLKLIAFLEVKRGRLPVPYPKFQTPKIQRFRLLFKKRLGINKTLKNRVYIYQSTIDFWR
jgi:hypothetical protein